MDKLPYSIRCLKAIEAYVGGRKELACRLGRCKGTVDSWFYYKRIPSGAVTQLVSLSDAKFKADELLGLHDRNN